MPSLDSRSAVQTITGSGSFAGPSPAEVVRGIVVLIAETVGVTDVIPDGNVTYGGTSVPRVQRAVDSAGEEGSVYAFFLGTVPPGINTGAQTVEITVASGTTDKRVLVLLLSAPADTILAESNTLAGDQANPSIALAAGQLCFACGVLFSGVNSPISLAPGAGFTDEAGQLEADFGTQSCSFIYSGSDTVSAEILSPTVAWTSGSDDVAAIGLAITHPRGLHGAYPRGQSFGSRLGGR